MGVYGFAVTADFEVKVGACGAAGFSDFGNELTSLDDVSGLDKVLVVVGIEGGPDGIVLDDDAVSES